MGERLAICNWYYSRFRCNFPEFKPAYISCRIYWFSLASSERFIESLLHNLQPTNEIDEIKNLCS